MKKHLNLIPALIAVLAISGIIYVMLPSHKYDEFAQCLEDEGTLFYGAFWCTHCQNQKALFGASKEFLPYIECSTADGKDMTQQCKDEGIKGFPTWKFADGSVESGELSLQRLSEKTSCPLPE
jgi:hypothetical protein